MNERMQTLLSSAVVSAVLWLGLAGVSPLHATGSNQPPGYGATAIIGSQIKAGEESLRTWQKTAVGELADYDAYTKKVENDDFVNALVEKCIESTGSKPPYEAKGKKCLFEAGNGLNLLISSLLGSPAFNDPDPSKPTNRNLAVAYVQNMTFAMPDYPGDNKIFKDKEKKDKLTEDGYAYFAQIFRQLPAISVSQNAMLTLVADRMRLGGMSAGLPVGANNAASILEMLHFEATRRYGDKSWFDNLSDPNQVTDRAVFNEIAYLLAFQNYMLVKTYEQNAQTQALLVAQLSGQTGLMSQMSGARASGKEGGKQLENLK